MVTKTHRATSARPADRGRAVALRHVDKPFKAPDPRVSKPIPSNGDIVRNGKPYRTVMSKVLSKKALHQDSFTTAPPNHYQFMLLGTPELAKRCKELSAQNVVVYYTVHDLPRGRLAQDPEKISHHTHRIGYHFHAEIIDQACNELGYHYSHYRFVKHDDLRAEQYRSQIAVSLRRRGYDPQAAMRDAPDDKIRAAIRELFPNIPDKDLEEILKHAWEKGAGRIGTNQNVSLADRIQLAVTARIRHTYTDYDRLLRAFAWKDCRHLVEPECLRKLIEWRGDHDDNDAVFEELVRETIVIDDDSDDEITPGGEATDSSAEYRHQAGPHAMPMSLHQLISEEKARYRAGIPPPNPANPGWYEKSGPAPLASSTLMRNIHRVNEASGFKQGLKTSSTQASYGSAAHEAVDLTMSSSPRPYAYPSIEGEQNGRIYVSTAPTPTAVIQTNGRYAHPGPIDAQIAPVQYAPRQAPQQVFYTAAPAYSAHYAAPTMVHGAPAPVQQRPREPVPYSSAPVVKVVQYQPPRGYYAPPPQYYPR